jgi:CRISPR/Cas system-associated exonuclease Cas4 (RecB family)
MLARVDACPASLVLTQYPNTGIEAIQGTANHEALEDGTRELPERARWLKANLEGVKEQSYVLDLRNCTARVSGVARGYGDLQPYEIGTTLDWWAFISPKKVRCLDYKSRERVTRARDNLQIISQAAALLSTQGDEVEIGLVYLDNGESDLVTWTAFDSPMLWRRLRAVADKARNAKPTQLHTGSHCKYCPALTVCPAQRATLATFVDVEAGIATMTPEQVGEAHIKLKTFEQMAKRVEEAIKLRVSREPVPLPDGKLLSLVECRGRDKDDVNAMKEKLSELGVDASQFRSRGNPYTQLKAVNRKES